MFQKTILDNGIRVITENIPEVRSIAIGVLIDAGPRDEKPLQRGIAHLVEHLMFQGTRGRDALEIARLMDAAGGEMGGFTTRDYTCYSATVLDDYRTYALDLLGDILVNSNFAASSIEKEKMSILREMSTSRDIPYERVHSLLKSTVWPGHPLGCAIAGEPDDLKSIERQDVLEFVTKNYIPSRMILTAAGNVDHQDFVATACDAFWQLSGSDEMINREPPRFVRGISVEYVPVSQAYFSLGIQAFPYAHPDRYAMHVLNNVLGGGISSRLFRRIRDDLGMVYDIHSEYHAYSDDGIWVIEGCTSAEYLIEVLERTLEELCKLLVSGEPVDDEELLKTKMHICGQHIIASENTSVRTARLGTQEFYFGQRIDQESILERINEVDNQTIQNISDQTLKKGLKGISLAVVGPPDLDRIDRYQLEKVVDKYRI